VSPQLRVGVIMGSDSDLPVMRHVGRALTALGLAAGTDYEERVVSAHRTPRVMARYAFEAGGRGLQVIVAGAGGSAHLPGMVAAETVLPVLGVAVTSSPDTLNRALGSMIGMPEGVPLAVFQGPAGAWNAGLFAARLLALHDEGLRTALVALAAAAVDAVGQRDRRLADWGAERYLADGSAAPDSGRGPGSGRGKEKEPEPHDPAGEQAR
jgi:5-(carboxyamino)imidazole ribonucleotide mutase